MCYFIAILIQDDFFCSALIVPLLNDKCSRMQEKRF